MHVVISAIEPNPEPAPNQLYSGHHVECMSNCKVIAIAVRTPTTRLTPPASVAMLRLLHLDAALMTVVL